MDVLFFADICAAHRGSAQRAVTGKREPCGARRLVLTCFTAEPCFAGVLFARMFSRAGERMLVGAVSIARRSNKSFKRRPGGPTRTCPYSHQYPGMLGTGKRGRCRDEPHTIRGCRRSCTRCKLSTFSSLCAPRHAHKTRLKNICVSAERCDMCVRHCVLGPRCRARASGQLTHTSSPRCAAIPSNCPPYNEPIRRFLER